MACIVPNNGAPRDADAARQLSLWCREQLAYYKAPGWVAFLDALPLTTTQKVRKAELRQLAEAPAWLADCFDMRAERRA